MPDLGIFGWIIVGLIAGALAGALVPGRQRYGYTRQSSQAR